ncbi:MAG TPA: XRE family transcriptional regulator [Candidatus Binatia bacterium]|nr:XRE family transcriptional regulator [Candidatus Binatia bacterium]
MTTTRQARSSKPARGGSDGPVAAIQRDDELGRRIRTLRTERGLTLTGLAARVGITRSFLSSVERGIAYPSLLVLRSIAAALEVPVFMLFTAPEANGMVVRKGARKAIRPPGAAVSYELVSPDLRRKIEMIIVRLKPGLDSAAMAHEGEECALVLHGRVAITVGDVEYELDEGDSIYYDSGLPHKARAVGDEPAEIVSAITPPNF